jgi:hypothetical protein
MSATYPPATATERRISLSRGPALIVGTILLAAGLYFMYRQHTYPRLGNFPNGGAPVDRHVWGIFGINGFTGLFTAVCGGLLLFGAAQHYLAKTLSLIVGVALGAAAIIGALSGNVLGLAASNGSTEVAWGIAAAILLINAVIPARRRVYETAGTGRVGAAGAGAVAGAAAGDVAGRRRSRRTAEAEDPAYAGTGRAAGVGTAGAGTGNAAGPAGAGTGTAAGRAGAGAGTGAAGATEPVAGEGAAGEGREVNDTHQVTGGSAASQSPSGEPVPVGGGNSPQEEQTGAGSGSGGGALSRLFGRRS